MTTTDTPSSPPAEPAVSAFEQWRMVVALTLTYTLSFIDRSALNIVVEPIRKDLNITDVQMSVLIGFSFMAMYTVVSIPAGYLTDRIVRRYFLAGAVVFWSGASAFCAHAGSYWQLFAGRAGLGAGEAALPPVAYSMMRDGVAEKNRGRAFAVYQAGVNLGYGLGALLGGFIFAIATAGVFLGLPLVGHLKPWQWVILIPAVAGIPVALLLCTIHEPRRPPLAKGAQTATFREMLRYLVSNWKVYFFIFSAMTLISLAGSGWNAWMATSLIRTWGLSPGDIGKTVGMMGLIMFPVATFVLGFLMDLIKKRGYPQAPFWVAMGGCLLNLGPALFIQHAPSIPVMWVAYFFSILFTTSGVQVACGMMLAGVTPGRLMGKMTSFYYMVINLIALGSGPTIVAAVAQYGFHGSRAISYSMTLCYSVFVLSTVVLLFFGSRELKKWYQKNQAEALVAA